MHYRDWNKKQSIDLVLLPKKIKMSKLYSEDVPPDFRNKEKLSNFSSLNIIVKLITLPPPVKKIYKKKTKKHCECFKCSVFQKFLSAWSDWRCQTLLCRQNEEFSLSPIDNSQQWLTPLPIFPFVNLFLDTFCGISRSNSSHPPIWPSKHGHFTHGTQTDTDSLYRPSQSSVKSSLLIAHQPFDSV